MDRDTENIILLATAIWRHKQNSAAVDLLACVRELIGKTERFDVFKHQSRTKENEMLGSTGKPFVTTYTTAV